LIYSFAAPTQTALACFSCIELLVRVPSFQQVYTRRQTGKHAANRSKHATNQVQVNTLPTGLNHAADVVVQSNKLEIPGYYTLIEFAL
jgi:hypothetical protein